jgi:bifunctional DNA-binding transcriptional regulator/antitoxin component of YhaV-PrlF toxin-antitoxin module
MTPERLERLISDLPTKSAKIRRLAEAGVPRAEIAKALGIRYQHVRNVLIADSARRAAEQGVDREQQGRARIKVGANGSAILPAELLAAAGIRPGDIVLATASPEVVEIITGSEAVRRAQALVRKYIPAGVNLVDELLADRRREVEQEERE